MNITPFGPFFAFMSSVTWAIGTSNYAKMTRDFSPFHINLSRAVFALPLFFIAVFVTGGGYSGGIALFETVQLEHLGWFSLSTFASYGLGDALFLWSTLSLGVPGALAIASGYPVLTALIGYLFLGEQLASRQWAGLLIAVAGIVVVILSDPKRAQLSPSAPDLTPASTGWLTRKPIGVLLALATAVCWATNIFAVAKGGQSIDSTVGNTIRMATAIVLTSFFSVVIGRAKPRVISRAYWRRYAWVFVIEAFGGSYFFLYGLSHSSLVVGSVFTSLAPVLSVPIAILMGLERFSLLRTAAVASVVLGLALI